MNIEKTTRTKKSIPEPPKSFVVIYKNLALPLMKFLVKRTHGDQDAAEEIFSRTMIAAWQGMHAFEHKSQFFTWVCRIGLNKMADYYREQIHRNSLLVAPTLEEWANIKNTGLHHEEWIILEDFKADVRECLHLLPYDKRKLLYLRFWRGLTLKSIATITGGSERAVEGKIYRAKMELKEIINLRHPELVKNVVRIDETESTLGKKS